MYKIGDYIMYDYYVCRINGILKDFFNNEDYYDMVSVYDESLSLKAPVSKSNLLKKVISKDKFSDLLNDIPNIDIIDIKNKNDRYDEYRKLINTLDEKNLIKIIKTEYKYNKKLKDQKELTYFGIAERIIYSEIAVVFDISYDDAKKFLIERIK